MLDIGYEVKVTLCHATSSTCPTVGLSHTAEPAKRVSVADDFGNRVYMSREQFEILLETARSGRIDF